VNRKEHWENVYAGKGVTDLTWFQRKPETSLSLIRELGLSSDARILDVGGGTSDLGSFLLKEGFRTVSVLDLSERALASTRDRMGPDAEGIEWLAADVLEFDSPHRWALWHDRAMFHFLTSLADREAYFKALNRGLEHGGHLIMATFALDGPSRCSGLDCVRYSPESLGAVLGPEYQLRGSVSEAHKTPAGGTQEFVYSWFQRRTVP